MHNRKTVQKTNIDSKFFFLLLLNAMYHSQIPIRTHIQKDFKRYLKLKPSVIDPYQDKQKFSIRDITTETLKADRLHKTLKRNIEGPHCLKVFDDPSLTYECQLDDVPPNLCMRLVPQLHDP